MKKIVVMAIVSVSLLSVEMGMLFVTQVVAEPASSPSHDVAVTEVGLYHLYRALGLVKPLIGYVAYPAWSALYINVTVKNEGDYSETFNVTVYYENTTGTYAIDTQTVNNLAPGAEKNLTFTWKPYLPGYPAPWGEPDHPGWPDQPAVWPYPVYTFSAEASVVPDEIDTADNSLIDGFVKVWWPGDANGDGRINILDLGKLGVHWESKYGEPLYSAYADFNGDGEVNVIDLGFMGCWWLSVVPGAGP